MSQRRLILLILVPMLAVATPARAQGNPSAPPTDESKRKIEKAPPLHTEDGTPGKPSPAPADEKTSNSGKTAPSHTEDGAQEKPDGVNAGHPPTPKPHKVLTNDDLNGMRRNDGFDGGSRDTHAIEGTGECDDTCADEAREMAGFGPEQDGEWRYALTAARRALAADRSWPGAYATVAGAVKQYCTYQQQVQATAVPSGNDYSSRVERARREKEVEDMSRVLEQNVQNANGRIDQMAQQAEENGEPARGAIMRVLAQRVNDSCDP